MTPSFSRDRAINSHACNYQSGDMVSQPEGGKVSFGWSGDQFLLVGGIRGVTQNSNIVRSLSK